MKTFLIVGNGLVIALILLIGKMYPSIKEWTQYGAGIFLLHLVLELVVAQLKLLDAAKISTWVLQSISAVVSTLVLLPYTLEWGDWFFIIAAAVVSFAVVVTVVVALVFRPGAAGDH
jgi:hypothetical protein